MVNLQILKRINKYPSSFLFQIMIAKITRNFIRIGAFYLLEYSGCPAPTSVRGPGKIRSGVLSDIEEMEALEQMGKGEIFQKRFSTDERCLVAVHHERIIGYEWFSEKATHCESRYSFVIPIPNDAFYAYDAFIHPDFRISGIWIRFQKEIGERMKELGKERIITLIDSHNIHSLKTHLQYGFHVFKRVLHIQLAHKHFFREKYKGGPLSMERGLLQNDRRKHDGFVGGE